MAGKRNAEDEIIGRIQNAADIMLLRKYLLIVLKFSVILNIVELILLYRSERLINHRGRRDHRDSRKSLTKITLVTALPLWVPARKRRIQLLAENSEA